MILFPPAKVNIGLNVLGRRQDGFHEIETVMMPIALCDILELLPVDHFEFKQSGYPIEEDYESNLCVRAYNAMQAKYDIRPVYMHLIKNIPMGAGLGGGSSDAAAVLLGLDSLFNLHCSTSELADIAAQLGSDCPFFIKDEIQLAKGRGELLSPVDLDLTSYWIKLINPGIHISTKEAYENVVIDEASDLSEIIKSPVSKWKDNIGNAFERSVFQRYPEIKDIKKSLYEEGALYASMSGSGSTVFGIYTEEPKLSPNYSDQWVFKLNV